jgi:surface carbohydrate biosynthesis protein
MIHSSLKQNDFKNITRSEFYKHDEKIFKHVSEYCKKKNLNLFVIGESKYYPQEEKEFYSQMTKNEFTFLKRNAEDSSYKYIDKFEYITGVDSTMLYESIARDKKVAFFSGRESCFKGNKGYFNWPSNIYPKGLFWTNETSKNEVFRVLNNLKNKKFRSTKNIIYDYKNIKLVKKLNTILNKI